MKYFKISVIGFLVMLTIQVGVLVFLETVYLADNASYTSKKAEDNSSKKPVIQEFALENGSSDIAASFNGKYLTYLKDNNLFVLDSENNTSIKVPADNGMDLLYYKWIYDRNRLLLVERPTDLNKEAFYKLYYYDVSSNSKVEINNQVGKQSAKIPVKSSDEKIGAIDLSTLNNIIYIKLSGSNNYCRVYSLNIMARVSSVSTVTHDIGKIISTKRDDILIYENLKDKKIYSSGGNSPLTIDGNSNFSLLGIDNNDNIYLALTDSALKTRIYYGNITNKDWKKIDLAAATDPKNIYINFDGQIFVSDTSKSTVMELLTGKSEAYSGNIIDINSHYIISENNNRILKTIYQ